MHRAILLFVFLILTQIVTACAPVPLLVYAPDGPGARVVYSSCTFNTHIPVGVKVEAAGIEAIVSLASHDLRTYVEARLDVPEGTIVTLQEGAVKVETADPQSSSRAVFPVVSLVDTPIVNNYSAVPALQQQRLPITASLIGQRVVAGNVSFNRHFWLATYIESASAQEVWITLPRFTVNGVLTSVPRIHFRRQTAMAVAVFNC
jgi:hypothetical protein